MPQRKLFISHSSRKQHVQLLRDTCTALLGRSGGALDYRLTYDQNGAIVAGDDWYTQIDRWMLECHAAVVLFSKRALYVSDWVKKEAAVLSWRQALDPEFKLIPVLLDGLQPKDLTRGLMGVLRIVDNAQCIDVGNDPAAIAAAVDDALRKDAAFTNNQAPEHDSVGEPAEGLITSILKEIDTALLGPVVAALGVDPPTWPPDQHTRDARAVTRYLLADRNVGLQRFIDALDRLPTLQSDRASIMRRHIGCLWVSREAASNIPAVRVEGRCIAMTSPYADFVPDRYVERAWPLTTQAKVVRVERTSHDLDQAKQEIEAAFLPPGRAVPPAVLKARMEERTGPIVVLLPLALRHLLTDLKDSYGNMIFVVLCDSEVPATVSAAMPAIVPPDATELIDLQWAKYLEVEDLISQRS